MLGLVIVCCAGVLCVLITFGVFMRYANTPIIKAAGYNKTFV
jgi:hypothetical protein